MESTARRTWERPQQGFWLVKFDPKGAPISRLWLEEDWQEAQRLALESSKQSGVRRVQLKDRTDMPISSFVGGRKLATKTHAEKEDEEAERLVRKSPPKKPPRTDLERRQVEDKDAEEDPDKIQDQRDRSHNFKHNAALIQRVAYRYCVADAEHKPSSSWKTDEGVWVAKNPKGNTHSFGKEPGAKDKAESYASGDSEEDEPESEDAPEEEDEAPAHRTKELEGFVAGLKPKRLCEILTELEGAFSRGGDLGQLKDEIKASSPMVAGILKGLNVPPDVFKTVGDIRASIEDREELSQLAGKSKKPPPKKKEESPPEPAQAKPDAPTEELAPSESPEKEPVSPPGDKAPEKVKSSLNAGALLKNSGVNSYEFDLSEQTPEFQEQLNKAVQDTDTKTVVKNALTDPKAASSLDTAVAEADEFFRDADWENVDVKVLGKHLATMAAKGELDKLLKDSDKAVATALKGADQNLSRTVSSLLENMGPAKRLTTHKELVKALQEADKSKPSLKSGVTDPEQAELLDEVVKKGEEFSNELDSRESNDDSPLDIESMAFHLSMSSLKKDLEVLGKDAEKITKEVLKKTDKEVASSIESLVSGLGPAAKILVSNQLAGVLEEAKSDMKALLASGGKEAEAAFQSDLKAAKKFFSTEHDGPVNPSELLKHAATLQIEAGLNNPLTAANIPDTPESKKDLATTSKDPTLEAESEAALDKVREKATEQAHKSFKLYKEGGKELRDTHIQTLEKEIEDLPPNSERRIMAEGMMRGLLVARVLDEGEEAVKAAPAFATLVKAANKSGMLDTLLNVHKKHDTAFELDQNMQQDINDILDLVNDDDWPDMLGENHPLHKMSLMLTSLDHHLSPSRKEALRQSLRDSIKTGLMIVDPAVMAEDPEDKVKALREKADRRMSQHAKQNGLTNLLGEDPSSDGWWDKLKAKMAEWLKSITEWSKSKVSKKGSYAQPNPILLARKSALLQMPSRVAARHQARL